MSDGKVALLAEGVDRNNYDPDFPAALLVALLAEGVDRNDHGYITSLAKYVALLAEGVDRNSLCLLVTRFHQRSPSSRRAWIEILYTRGL